MVKSKQKRGRPRKEFKPLPRDKSVKRERGRPRKKVEEKFQKPKAIIINEPVQEPEVEQEEVRFANHRIIKTREGTNFTVWLLIFSILILLFSLYKTFIKEQPQEVFLQTTNDETITTIQTGDTTVVTEIKKEELVQDTTQQETIINFYTALNNRDTKTLFTLADTALKATNTFKNYFTENWINRFLNGLANQKVYVGDIEATEEPTQFIYTVKYKLQDLNTLFEEQRKVTVKKVENEYKISSIRCVNTGCSRLPFFNPGKYGL